MGRRDNDSGRIPLEKVDLAASAVRAEGFGQGPGIEVDGAADGPMEVLDIQVASADLVADLSRAFHGENASVARPDKLTPRSAVRSIPNIALLSPQTLVETLNIFLREVTAAFEAGKRVQISADDIHLIEHSLRLVCSELEEIINLEKEILAHPANPDIIARKVRDGLHALISQYGIEFVGRLLQEVHELQRELAAMNIVRRHFFAKDKKDKLTLRKHQLAVRGVFVEEAIGIRGLRAEGDSFHWDSIDPDGPLGGLERSYETLLVRADVKKSWQMQWLVKKRIFERVKEELNAIELGGTPELLDLEAITRECREEEFQETPQGHS